MRTRLIVLGLLVVSVLSLTIATGTIGAADKSGYDITVDGSLDIPDSTVTFESDEYNITHLKAVAPGGSFTANFDVPSESTEYSWELRDLDGNLCDANTGGQKRGDASVSFDTSDYFLCTDGPLTPDTYVLTIDNDSIRTIFPIVVEGYDVTANVSRTAPEGGAITVNATVAEKPENEQKLSGVNVVIGNDTVTRTADLSDSAGNISERVSLGDLPPGNYSVFVAARGDDTFSGQRVPIGVSNESALNVTPAPRFSVSNLSAPASAVQGENVTVNATVENVGNAGGTTTAEVLFGLDVLTSRNVTLDAGEAGKVSFEVPTGGIAPGGYSIGVRAGDSTARTRLDVLQPATFSVSDLDAPASVTQNDTFTANATVENVGDVEGTTDVEFVFNGSTLENRTVTLGAGETRDVSFEASTSGTAPGAYTHGIRAGSSFPTATLDVLRPPMFSVSNLSAPASVVQGEPVTVNATVENLGGEGTTDVEFVFNGSTLDSRTVTLGAGEATNVSLEASTSAIPPGTYTHGIRAGDSFLTADITIEASTTCVAGAVSGDDDTISLAEIQRAINWWAGGEEVPGTGGETISLSEIQSLIDAWAGGESVSCGSAPPTCVSGAVAGEDGRISLPEIQRAIDRWADGSEVPDTGGETISLAEIQSLIDAWAEGTRVSCS